MSTAVFPSLVGLAFDVTRAPQWDTIVQEAVSGKETRVARRQNPRREWGLSFDILRSDSVNVELQNLEGFFNARSGMFDSFLFSDPDDNVVTGQAIANGDGATVAFQLVRSWGGQSEAVTAPNVVTAVYLNGVSQAGGLWSYTSWTAPSVAGGVLTFTSAPGAGVSITADFTYYWPVRFTADDMSFSKFMATLWANKKVGFKSII